jgi:hypothetical protein
MDNINKRQNNLSSHVELMRSQFLFEKAVSKLNYHVSIFSEGRFLTEERYNASNFYVLPFQLNDSSLIAVPIAIEFDGDLVKLIYSKNGKPKVVVGRLNTHLRNSDFDVIVKTNDVNEFQKDADKNKLSFTFNSTATFAAKHIGSLDVFPLDPAANTIQINIRGSNPQLCHDLALSVATAFMENYDNVQRQSSQNIIQFINQQVDSLGVILKNSKDSLRHYQVKANFNDLNNAEVAIADNLLKLREEKFILDEEIRSVENIRQRLNEDPSRLEVYRMIPEIIGKSFEQILSPQLTALYELLEKKRRVVISNYRRKSRGKKLE